MSLVLISITFKLKKKVGKTVIDEIYISNN